MEHVYSGILKDDMCANFSAFIPALKEIDLRITPEMERWSYSVIFRIFFLITVEGYTSTFASKHRWGA